MINGKISLTEELLYRKDKFNCGVIFNQIVNTLQINNESKFINKTYFCNYILDKDIVHVTIGYSFYDNEQLSEFKQKFKLIYKSLSNDIPNIVFIITDTDKPLQNREVYLKNKIIYVEISSEHNTIEVHYPDCSVERYNLLSEVIIPVQDIQLKFDLRELVLPSR